MSFAIKLVGKPADVAAAVRKDPHVPESIKDLVSACAAGIGTDKTKAIYVETNGHLGGNAWDSVNTLKIEAVTLVESEAPKPVEQAGTTAA